VHPKRENGEVHFVPANPQARATRAFERECEDKKGVFLI
jgi:hypothetical protein